MQDKQVSWWRKALKFALGGIRSTFGLFGRKLDENAPKSPPAIEGKREIEVRLYKAPEKEEIELSENSPKPEDVVLANHEEREPFVETKADAKGDFAPALPDTDTELADQQPTETIDEAQSFDESEAVSEPPSSPCANEGVDEVSLLAESANTDAAAPGVPEPDMNLDQSDREQAAEEKQLEAASLEPAEVSQVVSGPKDTSAAPPESNDISSTLPAAEPEAASADQTVTEPTGASAAQGESLPSGQKGATEQPHVKHFIKLEGRDKEGESSPFSVIVSQVYDGPLDLLLDLIRKQDIDIYDIPIARITAQFLAYVNQLKATDVDVAGEFIYTASLLIHIKSKMLLPRAPAGPDDQVEDPRRELVERLLEHERFKNAAQMLQQKQMLEAATWTNPGIREFREDIEAEPEIAADTVDLVRVFRDILERARNRPVLNLQEDSVTVGQMIQFLGRRLNMEDKPVALKRLLSHTKSERALIAMFLALLELVRLQAILLRQDRAFCEIFIKKNTEFDSVMNEGMANARDDWR